jgi:Rrf2 family protein
VTSSRFATAVHILTLLAYERDEALTSDYIAASVNTNPVVIRRLLKMLAEAGLVTSVRGTAGGTRLGKAAEAITLLDVFAAVEDDKLIEGHAQQPNPKCPVGSRIVRVLAPRIDAATEAFFDSLRETTIADNLKDLKKKK